MINNEDNVKFLDNIVNEAYKEILKAGIKNDPAISQLVVCFGALNEAKPYLVEKDLEGLQNIWKLKAPRGALLLTGTWCALNCKDVVDKNDKMVCCRNCL